MKHALPALIFLLLGGLGAAHMDMGGEPGDGMVMNENHDVLPPGCEEVTGWENVTVRAGRTFATQFPGTMFTFDVRDMQYPPCTKLTVTLVNQDAVRHQWMVHGLPESVYPMGMFNIEVTGPGQETGTFILPAVQDTLLVHCGVPQHEQKGMKAQILVGGGDSALPNIPGVSGDPTAYHYPREDPVIPAPVAGAAGIALGLLAATTAGILLKRRYARGVTEPAGESPDGTGSGS